MEDLVMLDREQKIKDLRLQGKTLQEIGDIYSLTRERIRQILKELGIEKPKLLEKENLKISYLEKTKQRLLKNIKQTDYNCWDYTGYKTKTGYGWFSYCGIPQYAHRISYQIFNNIRLKNDGRNSSETVCVLHICQNRSCVNPDHLYLGTQEDNARDRELDKINISR